MGPSVSVIGRTSKLPAPSPLQLSPLPRTAPLLTRGTAAENDYREIGYRRRDARGRRSATGWGRVHGCGRVMRASSSPACRRRRCRRCAPPPPPLRAARRRRRRRRRRCRCCCCPATRELARACAAPAVVGASLRAPRTTARRSARRSSTPPRGVSAPTEEPPAHRRHASRCLLGCHPRLPSQACLEPRE
jgi:hypothetical protein